MYAHHAQIFARQPHCYPPTTVYSRYISRTPSCILDSRPPDFGRSSFSSSVQSWFSPLVFLKVLWNINSRIHNLVRSTSQYRVKFKHGLLFAQSRHDESSNRLAGRIFDQVDAMQDSSLGNVPLLKNAIMKSIPSNVKTAIRSFCMRAGQPHCNIPCQKSSSAIISKGITKATR